MIFEEREKRKIRKTFSQYLSPGVTALIEKEPQKYIGPGGETKELTVMFSDIREFTSLSDRGNDSRRTRAPAQRVPGRNDGRLSSRTWARLISTSATPSWRFGCPSQPQPASLLVEVPPVTSVTLQ